MSETPPRPDRPLNLFDERKGNEGRREWNKRRQSAEESQAMLAGAVTTIDRLLAEVERLRAVGLRPEVEKLMAEWDREVREHGIWTSAHSIAARIVAAWRAVGEPAGEKKET